MVNFVVVLRMGVTIRWLGHASFQIKAEDKVVYLDLYRSKQLRDRVPDDLEPATVVLVTHDQKLAEFCNRRLLLQDGAVHAEN